MRFGKYTTIIYALAALVVLEFVGLAGILISGNARPQPAAAYDAAASSVPDEAVPVDSTIPEWLEAAPPLPEEKAPPAGELTALEILDQAQLIAHGMGSLDGETTLNCLEGFQENYALGVRVFEVDLRLTSDQKVVLRHDWRAGWQQGVSETSIPTVEEFLDKPVLKKYTSMSFKDLLYLMRDYPDICIITDTKFTDAEIVKLQFEAMLQDARELGLSYLFDRMIIQVYTPLMFRVVDSLHHFNYYIYTLYYEGFSPTEDDFRERASFCKENHILGITMWDYWWRERFAPLAEEYGLNVYTHTVNEPEDALELLDEGVRAVYTDELLPEDLIPQLDEAIDDESSLPEDETDRADSALEDESAPEDAGQPADNSPASASEPEDTGESDAADRPDVGLEDHSDEEGDASNGTD